MPSPREFAQPIVAAERENVRRQMEERWNGDFDRNVVLECRKDCFQQIREDLRQSGWKHIERDYYRPDQDFVPEGPAVFGYPQSLLLAIEKKYSAPLQSLVDEVAQKLQSWDGHRDIVLDLGGRSHPFLERQLRKHLDRYGWNVETVLQGTETKYRITPKITDFRAS